MDPVLGLWLLCMFILGIYVWLYLKRQRQRQQGYAPNISEGFDVTSDYKRYLDIVAAKVETYDALRVANGDDISSLPNNAMVFASDYAKTIKVHVPPRVSPRCSPAPAGAGVAPLTTCSPAPAGTQEQTYTVAEILVPIAQFTTKFKSIIDSRYKGDPYAAQRDIMEEARAYFTRKFPMPLATFALIKYKGDVQAAREALLQDDAAIQKELDDTKRTVNSVIQVVALGLDPFKTPESQKFSTRLAAYTLAKNNGNDAAARQDILTNRDTLEQERIAMDYELLLQTQDLSGTIGILNETMYPGPKDTFNTTFPKPMAIYALAMTELDSKRARALLFSSYDQIQAKIRTQMYPESEKNAWNANPRGKTCERIQNLYRYFNDRKAGIKGLISTDISGAMTASVNSTIENKKFQYAFEQVCKPLMKRDKNSFTVAEKKKYTNCMLMANIDPVLYPMLKLVEATYSELYMAEQAFEVTGGGYVAIFDTLNKIKSILGCDSTVQDFSFSMKGDIGEPDSYTLRDALNEISPYYLAPEVLDFVTKYLLSVTEIDESTMRVKEYLEGTEGNRNTVFNLIANLVIKEAKASGGPPPLIYESSTKLYEGKQL